MARPARLIPLLVVLLTGPFISAAEDRTALGPPPGGANSAEPAPPPAPLLDLTEIPGNGMAIRVPTGTWNADGAEADNTSVPGPIASFKGADDTWRGYGYLETLPRLVAFTGTVDGKKAHLAYTFEGDKQYVVDLDVAGRTVRMSETSDLGPKNVFVFDCTYGGWQPTAAFAADAKAENHAFVYLPCYYDKAEVTINPAAEAKTTEDGAKVVRPMGVAVVSRNPAKRDVAGFWGRDTDEWKRPDRMGIQLWQRRQLPGDPASRHFLGPETKSDSTPNPRTADMLGQSLYEPHVTIEMALGVGTRRLGFAAVDKGETPEDVPEAFKRTMKEAR